MKKTIYLANPYGFSIQQKRHLLPEFVSILKSLGTEVWEPFSRNNQIDLSKEGWAYKVGQADLRDVVESDATFAIVNGTPPDEGVMIELGAAIALGKKTFLFRDDFRHCTDSEHYPLNLMVFTGLPEEGWQDYYYTSVDEIANPRKALVRWLANDL
ncbi:MAG: nucleoside 2-deoxyribosyltransferase [Candidatus Latescibacteria bacterium]|nr:nucleoside 2-deoxyribosyltransferase [Candidatus Latescibacterota bacterium]